MNKARYCKMKAIYSIVTIILAFMIAIPTAILPASAYTADKKGTITYNYDFYNANKNLCDTIYNGMLKFEAPIDIESFDVVKADARTAFQTVVRMHPELFYVNTVKVGYASSGTQTAMIFPFYYETSDSVAEKNILFNQKTEEILAEVDSSMTDLQKALVIHDQLVLGCTYGTGSNDSQGASAYDCMVNGTSVCQGYALAYSYLLSMVGISSEHVESTAMCHAWTKVQIGGSYYNVDVTYDDPTPDRAGFVSHTYFMLSDNAIGTDANGVSSHYDFDGAHYKATSTKYDNKLFHEIDTQFCYVNSAWYSIDNKAGSTYEKNLIDYNPDKDTVNVISKFDYVWRTSDGTGHWKGGYMSLDEQDEILYYNSTDSIYTYNPATAVTAKVQDGATKNSSKSLYGMFISDNEIFGLVSSSPNDTAQTVNVGNCVKNEETLPSVTITTPDITLTKGDTDGDGMVGISDATNLQRYFAGIAELTDAQLIAADANGDGCVDISDATLIQRYVAGLQEM